MKKILLHFLGFMMFAISCQNKARVSDLMEKVQTAMIRQDSIMKVAHDKLNKKHSEWNRQYDTLAGLAVDSAHVRLEKAHKELLDKHDDIIDKHEVVLKLHRKLIEKYKKGVINEQLIEEEHLLLEEEHKLMQMDHQQLLTDHDKLEQEHQQMLVLLKDKNVTKN